MLIVALCLSAVAAFYSIVGLTAIFAAAVIPIILMGSILEVAKVTVTIWLHEYWAKCRLAMKLYLVPAVGALMVITSMGIFGFLTKAHIDQTLTMAGDNSQRVQILDQKISNVKTSIEDVDKQIAQIDAAINKMTDRGQAATSLRAADQQRKTREALIKKRDDHVKDISELTTERVRIQSDLKKIEAEVGPLRYISEILYEDQSSENLERSVRLVILLLVCVFDPLAIVLLIAANHGIVERKRLTIKRQRDTIEITDNDILKI